MAAILTSEMGSKDNVAKYMRECRQIKIAVMPPDINESNWSFTVTEEGIRFGLGAVKGVGSSAVEALLEARLRVGRFGSLLQCIREVEPRSVNQKAFDCLIKAGSFDSLGVHRRALTESLEGLMDWAQTRRREIEEGQGTLFAAGTVPEPEPDASMPPWPDSERLRYEKESLSFYLTGNPLSEHAERLAQLVTHTTRELNEGYSGAATVGGLVSNLRTTKIRSGPNEGRLMGRFVLEDLEGSIPVAVFADQLQRYGHLLQEEAAVVIKGSLRNRGSEGELTVEEIVSLERATEGLVDRLDLTLPEELSDGEFLKLRDCLIEHSGEVPIRFWVHLDGRRVRIDPAERFRVRPSGGILESIEAIIGPGNVRTLYRGSSPSS